MIRTLALGVMSAVVLAGTGTAAGAAPSHPAQDAPNPATTTANQGTVWLCHPDKRRDPCDGSLTTTYQRPDGSVRTRTPRPGQRAVDCFYLYPTASMQPGPVADLTIEPEERSFARYQVARFSQVCRVYAPMYRQVTLAGLSTATAADREIAYRSALSGWRDYLRHYNHGRGVILIGHSQGAGVLRRILAETVDGRPAIRSRVVSAILAGAAVAVRKDGAPGGDFRHIRPCRSASDVHCVISYATFDDTPPADTYFGVLREPWGSTYEALCVDPARLAGSTGPLRALYPTKPMAGVFQAAQQIIFRGEVPTAATPWVSPADRYRARCVTSNGAHVLMARPIGDSTDLVAVPTPAWGLHLLDLNLPLGDLIEVTGRQIAAFSAHTPARPGRG